MCFRNMANGSFLGASMHPVAGGQLLATHVSALQLASASVTCPVEAWCFLAHSFVFAMHTRFHSAIAVGTSWGLGTTRCTRNHHQSRRRRTCPAVPDQNGSRATSPADGINPAYCNLLARQAIKFLSNSCRFCGAAQWIPVLSTHNSEIGTLL
jgi:hypothetical protein